MCKRNILLNRNILLGFNYIPVCINNNSNSSIIDDSKILLLEKMKENNKKTVIDETNKIISDNSIEENIIKLGINNG